MRKGNFVNLNDAIPPEDQKLRDSVQKTKHTEEKVMQTKSRYEVISDLEQQKRNLIKERDGLKDALKEKEKDIKDLERKKSDTVLYLDRQIEDAKDDLENFQKTLEERKETISELIKGVDESLQRFNEMQQK